MRKETTKSNLRDETIDKIQDLIAINIDSAKGFREAADLIDTPMLKTFFSTQAVTRESFAEELQDVVELNDEEPRDSGSIKATFHRWWLNIRTALSTGDTHAILAECERGEDQILVLYKDISADTLGTPVNALLKGQLRVVQESHDRVRDMRDAAKVAK